MHFPGVWRDLTVTQIKTDTEKARAGVMCLFSRKWGMAGRTEMAVLIINEFLMQFALNRSGTIIFHANFRMLA